MNTVSLIKILFDSLLQDGNKEIYINDISDKNFMKEEHIIVLITTKEDRIEISINTNRLL